jgi:hypothetical protein
MIDVPVNIAQNVFSFLQPDDVATFAFVSSDALELVRQSHRLPGIPAHVTWTSVQDFHSLVDNMRQRTVSEIERDRVASFAFRRSKLTTSVSNEYLSSAFRMVLTSGPFFHTLHIEHSCLEALLAFLQQEPQLYFCTLFDLVVHLVDAGDTMKLSQFVLILLAQRFRKVTIEIEAECQPAVCRDLLDVKASQLSSMGIMLRFAVLPHYLVGSSTAKCHAVSMSCKDADDPLTSSIVSIAERENENHVSFALKRLGYETRVLRVVCDPMWTLLADADRHLHQLFLTTLIPLVPRLQNFSALHFLSLTITLPPANSIRQDPTSWISARSGFGGSLSGSGTGSGSSSGSGSGLASDDELATDCNIQLDGLRSLQKLVIEFVQAPEHNGRSKKSKHVSLNDEEPIASVTVRVLLVECPVLTHVTVHEPTVSQFALRGTVYICKLTCAALRYVDVGAFQLQMMVGRDLSTAVPFIYRKKQDARLLQLRELRCGWRVSEDIECSFLAHVHLSHLQLHAIGIKGDVVEYDGHTYRTCLKVHARQGVDVRIWDGLKAARMALPLLVLVVDEADVVEIRDRGDGYHYHLPHLHSHQKLTSMDVVHEDPVQHKHSLLSKIKKLFSRNSAPALSRLQSSGDTNTNVDRKLLHVENGMLILDIPIVEAQDRTVSLSLPSTDWLLVKVHRTATSKSAAALKVNLHLECDEDVDGGPLYLRILEPHSTYSGLSSVHIVASPAVVRRLQYLSIPQGSTISLDGVGDLLTSGYARDRLPSLKFIAAGVDDRLCILSSAQRNHYLRLTKSIPTFEYEHLPLDDDL